MFFKDTHQFRDICPIINFRVYIYLLQAIIIDIARFPYGPIYMIHCFSTLENIEFRDEYRYDIWHIFKLCARICNISSDT